VGELSPFPAFLLLCPAACLTSMRPPPPLAEGHRAPRQWGMQAAPGCHGGQAAIRALKPGRVQADQHQSQVCPYAIVELCRLLFTLS